jgi:hypothetical protein
MLNGEKLNGEYLGNLRQDMEHTQQDKRTHHSTSKNSADPYSHRKIVVMQYPQEVGIKALEIYVPGQVSILRRRESA